MKDKELGPNTFLLNQELTVIQLNTETPTWKEFDKAARSAHTLLKILSFIRRKGKIINQMDTN